MAFHEYTNMIFSPDDFAHLKIPLEDILSATNNFSNLYICGKDAFETYYKVRLLWSSELINIYAGRLNKECFDGDQQFWTEVSILSSLKHKNLVSFVGFCDDNDEKVTIIKRETRGSLQGNLRDPMRLTWVRRLEISVGIAQALSYIHYDESRDFSVIHRSIESSLIYLNDDWEPKLGDFIHSMKIRASERHNSFGTDKVWSTDGYTDPTYIETKSAHHKSDMYSFGIVMFELLCGRKSVIANDFNKYLAPVAITHYREKKLDEIIDWSLRQQMDSQSFNMFAEIAYDCLKEERSQRPDIGEIFLRLVKALELARENKPEDYEKWEPKLPKDYKEIIQMSKCPEVYSAKKKEELHNIFSKGILLQQDKVLLSFDGNGERNEMVSATMFSYKNACPHEQKSLPESRFETVVEILDISNLFIEIKTRAQFLSPNVVYGVYLVFKLCDSIKFSTKPMCVNLKYRKGLERLHAYFATWRDKEWMMIELYQFLNQNEDVVFEFLLEGFSSYYCGETAVYVEGIEFRAIGKVKQDEIGKLMEVQQVLKSNFNVNQVQKFPTNFEEIKICRNYDELFWLGEVDEKKLLVLSAKAALYEFFNVDLFTSKPSAQSRFPEVIELLPQQVFYINCTIRSQMLSRDTEYVCYLVFKLSEKCQGLHCPVKVRDILHQENNEAEFVYFITPSPSNINGITRVPKQRGDGWMEIQVWKFNSTHEFKDDSLSMNIKFTSHEGIMSGLIVCGLEFRPMFSGNSDDIQGRREKIRLQDEVPKPTHSA